jgi:hypothetical protein
MYDKTSTEMQVDITDN